MAVDKGLYAAPAGLEADMPEEALEIEIVNIDIPNYNSVYRCIIV